MIANIQYISETKDILLINFDHKGCQVSPRGTLTMVKYDYWSLCVSSMGRISHSGPPGVLPLML